MTAVTSKVCVLHAQQAVKLSRSTCDQGDLTQLFVMDLLRQQA